MAEIPNPSPPPDWNRMRIEFIHGAKPRELAKRFKVTTMAVYKRCADEHWTRMRKVAEKSLLRTAVSDMKARARSWQAESLQRSERFRASVMTALESADAELSTKDKPLALDQLTKAEMRVDDMGRRALGIVDPKHVDITSGGMPLGAFADAIAEVRKMISEGTASARVVDVEAMASEELVKDGEEDRATDGE